ncbi:MAG: hypothetical protein KJ906_02290 [Nanoarchaeota archaeon]|nr:hypothetical protein [Nanoarchaeota archaeon]
MKLEDILLKRGEVPVVGNHVFVPIHPKLFDQSLEINKNLAQEVFPEAAQEWYNDMEEHVKTTDDKQTKFLFSLVSKSKKPLIKKIDGKYAVIRPEYQIESKTEGMLTNGLVKSFVPWGGGHGSLGLAGMSDDGPEPGIDIESTARIGPRNTRFSEEKFKEYCFIPKDKINDYSHGTAAYAYTQHNVDIYFQASFLECWVRNYLNEVMKRVL